MRNDDPPPSRSQLVRDHPAPLGELSEIFERRNISVGIDSSGQVVLARPNSLLARIETGAQRSSLADYVAKYDDNEAELIRNPDQGSSLPFVTLRVPGVERELVNAEGRWTLGRVQAVIDDLAALDPPVQSELNHVVFGEQVVKGNPLGALATWAGEMAFLGNVAKTKPDDKGVRHRVLLSTAEPGERPRVLRKRLDISTRRRPQILVLDTGLHTVQERNGTRRPGHEFLECCKVHSGWRATLQPDASGRIPVDDEDEPDDDGTRSLDFEAGHGTFIAGIIAQLCPDAEIHIAGVLSSFGDGDVAGVIDGLRSGLVTAGQVDLVVMSFGAHLADDEPGVFGESVLKLLGDDVLGVAAAGNQGTCRPFFPAALPDVIGVGAVSAAGRAWFSNFGGWVDACAPGVDVVSTFLDFVEAADLFPDEDAFTPRVYKRWASWSGTSFSAPKVAAVLAQEMYLNLNADGSDLITAKEAWRRLTTHNHLRMPDLGVVFNA